jgi:hypothetical protein
MAPVTATAMTGEPKATTTPTSRGPTTKTISVNRPEIANSARRLSASSRVAKTRLATAEDGGEQQPATAARAMRAGAGALITTTAM